MGDNSNLECLSDFSTGSDTIVKRNQQLWDALNTQRDQIVCLCTSIIQVIVTSVKQLQDDHDPKKILDKENLRKTEHDFNVFVRLLTDGLKKLREFSVKCREVKVKTCNQSESDYTEKGSTSTNEDSKQNLVQTEELLRNDQDEDSEVVYKNGYEKFPFPIDLDLLDIGDDVLGRGHFSEVRKGSLQFASRETSAQVVAVKVLNSNNTERQFRNETGIMRELEHLNIIAFIGVNKKMIVMEYADMGSLQKYLCTRRRQKQPLHLCRMIQICMDVAAGMKYLADLRIIHGDIAARNILLNSDFQAKITDFGLSRRLDKGSCFVKKLAGEISPIWWSSPEVLLKRIFTIKSDVWSFGVLMWEIFTHGKTPSLCSDAREIIFTLEKKIRLPQTDNCPTNVYAVMTNCWEEKTIERPDFNMLYVLLSKILNTQKKNEHDEVEEIFFEDENCANGKFPGYQDDSTQFVSLGSYIPMNMHFIS